MRAPFQVLVFPFRKALRGIEYAAFHRADMPGVWQAIAGGGEGGESPLEAAAREANEEAGIPAHLEFVRLDSCSTVPVEWTAGFLWGPGTLVIPEHAFGVDVAGLAIEIGIEHVDYRWGEYTAIADLLKWDSNRSALWELNWRLTHPSPEN